MITLLMFVLIFVTAVVLTLVVKTINDKPNPTVVQKEEKRMSEDKVNEILTFRQQFVHPFDRRHEKNHTRRHRLRR